MNLSQVGSVLLSLTLLSSTCLAADSASLQTATQNIVNFHVVVPNMIYRGARPGAHADIKPKDIDADEYEKLVLSQNMRTLKNLGVKTIVDLQGGDTSVDVRIPDAPAKYGRDLSLLIDLINHYLEPGERNTSIRNEQAQAKMNQIRFEHHPLNSIQPVTAQEDIEIKNILKIMNNKDNQPVYVHCEHGHDRTGMIIALYQVCFNNQDPEAAYNDMIGAGHNPNDHVTESMDIYFWRAVASPKFCQF